LADEGTLSRTGGAGNEKYVRFCVHVQLEKLQEGRILIANATGVKLVKNLSVKFGWG
jgi:hypothetical protein